MSYNQENSASFEKKTIDLSIKMILIFVLIGWSAMIIFPFISPMLWGAILAITLYPMYGGLLKLVKGKNGLAGTIYVQYSYTLLPNSVQLLQTIHFTDILLGKPNDTTTDFYYASYEYVHS